MKLSQSLHFMLIAGFYLLLALPASAANATGSKLDENGDIVFSIYPHDGTDAGTVILSPGGGVTASGDFTANGAINATGNVTTTGGVSAAVINSSGSVSAAGGVSAANVNSSGDIAAAGVVSGTSLTAGAGTPISANSANVLGNLVAATACATNTALTKNGDGTFSCIAVTDLIGVGKVTLPNCGSTSYLTYDGTAFACAAPTGVNISCPGGQALTGIANNQPICAAMAPANSDDHVLLNTLTASNSSNLVDTTSFSGAYHYYEILYDNVLPSTNNVVFNIQELVNGSWVASGYQSLCLLGDANGVGRDTPGVLTTALEVTSRASTSYTGVNGFTRVANPTASGNYKMFYGQVGQFDAVYNFPRSTVCSSIWEGGSQPVTGLLFFFSSGNIASGTIKIYGWN